MGQELVDGEPVVRVDELVYAFGQVVAQIVPDDDQRCAELGVRGARRVAVVVPVDALAPAGSPVAGRSVDQSGRSPGLQQVRAATDRRRRDLPRTRIAGVQPRRGQVREVGGVIENPASSSKTSQVPSAARVLPPPARPP